MAQRRASRPSDKNIPDGIEELILGDGVQQYKRLRDFERRLDATMIRKRLDLTERRHTVSKRYKTMRIWISNTFETLGAQESGLDPIYDFSGSTAGQYRMKIEGRLLDDDDDDVLSDRDDSDSDEEGKEEGNTIDHDGQPVQKSAKPIPQQPHTKLSHFFKQITLELHRDKNTPADFPTYVEWKKPAPNPKDVVLSPGADFDSLEIERRFDATVNCTINLYRDDDRYQLSDPLAEVLDSKIEDRKSITMGIYDYIRALNLQHDDEKRAVQCDDLLRK
ncbi:MAG: hypothetical protein Q9224_001885, partial [Gallowayella concinna]